MIIICLNLLCSLCPLAFGAPEAMADPDIVIQVKQIVGSSDGGLSDDGAADEAPTEEGYMTEAPVEQEYMTEAPAEQEYTTEVPPIECPTESGWEETGQGCYLFIIEDSFDKAGAEDRCNSNDGSKLAVLDTEEKRAAMYTYMKDNYNWDEFWVGAEYSPNTEAYLWDGTSVQVEGWSANQPDTESDCVMADTYNTEEGKYFKTKYCGATKYAAICERTDAGANTEN